MDEGRGTPGTEPLRPAAATGGAAQCTPAPGALSPGLGNQERACACAKGPPAPAPLQVRSRFRPAFPRRKRQGPRMRFLDVLLGPGRGGSRLQVIPPLPRSAGPIARLWAGFSRRRSAHALRESGVDWLAARAQVRASYWVWAEREPPRLLQRLQVSARTRRRSGQARVRARACRKGGRERDCGACSLCSAPSAPSSSFSAVAAAAEARREGAASPVGPLVPPREEPAERSSARRPGPRPPLCRCL